MGKRDARADLLDDDPFRNTRAAPRIHRVHQRQAPDGTVHFETSSGFSNALMQFLGQDRKKMTFNFDDSVMSQK